jgi:hypothetical protein
MIRRVQSSVPTTKEEERRPAAILAIYTWDMLLALLALLGALAAFGGQVTVGSRTVNVSVAEQILAAVESASFAALLIILATLLTRRQRWVRSAQMATLAIAVVIGAVSLLLSAVLPGQGLQTSALAALLVLVVDVAAIVALTAQKVTAWYSVSGRMPRYISGTIGFWAASSAVVILLQALR